jgi:hypothetical protein
MKQINVKDYIYSTTQHLGGIRKLYKFPNGYGASVIYGGIVNMFRPADSIEIAVLKFHNDGTYEITYDTPLTDDVIVINGEDECKKVLEQIAKL